MEEITLGQIKDAIIFITAILGGIGALYGLLMAGIKKLLQPIKDELQNEKKERLKSDLTTFMYLAEFGNLSNEQKIRAHEEYDMYVKIGGNSWVKEKMEQLHKENKI
jgi:hypothetical protein